MAIEKIDVVIPAAGAGRRMGAAVPKQYLRIAGREILARTADIFLSLPFAGRIIIALSADDTLFDTLDTAANPRVVQVTGGRERSDSVLAGLRASQTEFTLVHDAARPMVRPADIERLVALALDDESVVGFDADAAFARGALAPVVRGGELLASEGVGERVEDAGLALPVAAADGGEPIRRRFQRDGLDPFHVLDFETYDFHGCPFLVLG